MAFQTIFTQLYFSLRERGIQACGTVRPSRKDIPKESMAHKFPLVKNLQHGECTLRQKQELVALTWKDKKPVHLIFGCPVGIKLYNASMGGVDLADQRIASYKKTFQNFQKLSKL